MADKVEIKRFTTPPFVLSYPHIWKPQASNLPGAQPKYSCQAIWTPSKFSEKDKKLWAALNAEIFRVCTEQFKLKGPFKSRTEMHNALREKLGDNVKFGIRDGKQRADQKGYGEGTFFASLTSIAPPGVVNLAKEDISPADGNADEMYPGAVFRARVTVYAYDKNGGKGYALGLGNLQKIKDGERLDSRVAAADDFDEEVDGAWLDAEDEAAGEDTDNFES